ncbi:MAG: hypothetical protein KGL16_10410, partial [Acidobacteriota bacterium]|nr:hypothetical protein [Acidobacteriota bacterium]
MSLARDVRPQPRQDHRDFSRDSLVATTRQSRLRRRRQCNAVGSGCRSGPFGAACALRFALRAGPSFSGSVLARWNTRRNIGQPRQRAQAMGGPMRLTPMAALALAWLPTAAVAYQTTDQIMWPAQGIYPAYPAEEQAPARPVQFFVSGGLYHDSNLFRLSDSANTQALLGTSQRSDNIRRVGVGFKADLPISRQHLLFDARVDDFHYSTFGFLDHSQYGGSATWKWQAGSRWSGDLGYARQRFLSGFGLLQLPQKNLVTESHAYASVNRLLTPRWRARGALDRTSYDYSNLAAATGALSGATPVSALDRATSLTLGGDYLTPPGNSVGAQVKLTDGRYVNPPGLAALDNTYRETEVSGVADWRASG